MATPDDDTTTAPPPTATAPTAAATPDMLAQAQRLAQQFLPAPVQVDTTPVNRSFLSLLGEAVGGGKTIPMSPADEQRAGLRALGDFGTSLMAASHYQPGQTVFSNLAQGFQGAERSMTGSEQMAAGTLAAQQGYQQQQLQNRLAALKEAIPLLRMQQAAGLPNPFAQGTAPGTGGGIGATGAPITAANQGDFVQKFTPIAQTIATKTGLPVNYVIAQAGLETGWGSSPAAARNNYFGISDSSGKPLSYASPEEGIKAYTDLMATDRYKNVPRTGSPAAIGDAMAVAGYNPNVPRPGQTDSYGTRVGSFAAGLGKPPAPPTTTAAAPPATTTASPATPAPYKVASTGATPPPPSGASTAPVTTGLPVPPIQPTTTPPAGPTAPTIAQGGPPTVTPPAQPTPQVTTPPALDLPNTPDQKLTPEQYVLKHWTPLTPEEVGRYAPGPENQLAVDRAQQVQQARADANAARSTYLNVQRGVVSGDLNKSLSDMNTADARADAAEKDYNTAVQGLKTEGAKNLLAADDQQRQQLRADFKSIVTDPAAAAALKTQEGEQAIALANIQSKNKIAEIQAQTRSASQGKVEDEMNATTSTSREGIQQLSIARALSRQAGDPTFWQTVKASHPELVSAISNMGGLSDDQVTQLGYSGAMDAAMAKLVTMARSGSGFQRVTNMDLQLLQSQAPTGIDPQQWREGKMAYLQSLMERQLRYASTVHALMTKPGMDIYDAQDKADTVVPSAAPQIPDFKATPQKSVDAQQQEWYHDNLSPNTFFRAPDGKHLILYAPPGQ